MLDSLDAEGVKELLRELYGNRRKRLAAILMNGVVDIAVQLLQELQKPETTEKKVEIKEEEGEGKEKEGEKKNENAEKGGSNAR